MGGWKSIIINKLKHLGIPFVVFTIITMVIKVMFASHVERASAISVTEFVMAILEPYNGPLRELWFIGALMWMFVFGPIWKVSLKTTYGIVAAIVVLITLKYAGISMYLLSVGSFCRFIIFFYCGILACKYQLIERINDKIPQLVLLLIGIVIYVGGRYLDEGFVTAWGGIILSIAIALMLDKYLPHSFASFRNYTMQIYLMGLFVQMIVKMIHLHIGHGWLLFYIISMLTGIYIPVAVAKIVERLNWSPLLACLGMKKRIK